MLRATDVNVGAYLSKKRRRSLFFSDAGTYLDPRVQQVEIRRRVEASLFC